MSARGFTAIPNHILRDKDLPASTRLLYGVILSYAIGTRICTASAGRLADETGIGRTAFFDGIRTLREHGYVEVQKRNSPKGWRNVYVPVVRGVEVSDEDTEGVVRIPDEGSSATRTGGRPPDGHRVRSKEEEESTTDVVDRAREHPRVTFGGKAVPADVAAEAITALGVFGDKTGQSLSPFTGRGKPSDALTRIVGAMLDYPEVRVWWPQMIDVAVADPWWRKRAPGTGVVFGPGVVEQTLSEAKSPTPLRPAAGGRRNVSTVEDYMAIAAREDNA